MQLLLNATMGEMTGVALVALTARYCITEYFTGVDALLVGIDEDDTRGEYDLLLRR